MNIIIPVQSHEDAKHLAAAGRVIGRLGCGSVWVLLSPAITVTEDSLKAATAAIDKDIADLRKAEASAVAVKDYKTAEEYKGRIEGLLTNRATTIRNAWKNIPENVRKQEGAKYNEIFGRAANPENTPKPGWRVSLSAEHHPHENWLILLNEHSGKATWHEGMKPGQFCVMWPGQLAEMDIAAPRPIRAAVQSAKVEVMTKVPVPTIKSRRAELEGLRHFALASVAKKLNVAHEKRPKAEIIDDILNAETLASM